MNHCLQSKNFNLNVMNHRQFRLFIDSKSSIQSCRYERSICLTFNFFVNKSLTLFHIYFLETDECVSIPCLNGGTCTDLFNDYNCTCVTGINRHCVSDEIDTASKRIYDGDGKISEMKNSIQMTWTTVSKGKTSTYMEWTTVNSGYSSIANHLFKAADMMQRSGIS
jgi:hypothetical protein